ncbi:RNA 2',3'-cyclic phosphodiesterase [Deinococcus maricopensis]|uniref:RNA 2',3'-cyclic phosphodiesterase n=1 Tax=Deinococcus maricopensis (strain DSM 21211 / LMG 22137 / NRRL B-23946 / LB-34) TaxID=709986 RepID=E8UBN6_DEIML|nr:RNA 2',3'-cyclic phosphodiesterase [Deinococcus maricopensis]ADV68475.1 2'-5' RNA ligase [Deinococcus maricopensis DSM 21211]
MTGRPRTPRPAPRRPNGPNVQGDGTLRLFFGLKVPREIADELALAQRDLRGNWRAVRPDQLHVTLAFLPNVPPERLTDLKRLGTHLAANLPPVQLRLRGTGYFPNEGSPRVWFVKVDAPELTTLAADLRTGLADLGVNTDDLPFKAHVTLARKKGPAPRLAPKTFDLAWDAGAFSLVQSTLRKTGPIYETLSIFKFRGEPPAPHSDPAPTEVPTPAADPDPPTPTEANHG